MYTDINAIMKANWEYARKNKKPYWFGAAEMQFFGTKVDDTVIEGRYFFTCEREPGYQRIGWTVRECTEAGEIRTVGSFFAHKTLNKAKRFLHRKLTQGEGV